MPNKIVKFKSHNEMFLSDVKKFKCLDSFVDFCYREEVSKVMTSMVTLGKLVKGATLTSEQLIAGVCPCLVYRGIMVASVPQAVFDEQASLEVASEEEVAKLEGTAEEKKEEEKTDEE